MQEDCTEVNLKQDLTKCKIVKEFQLERQWLENHPAPCFEIHSVLTCLQKVEMQLAPHD